MESLGERDFSPGPSPSSSPLHQSLQSRQEQAEVPTVVGTSTSSTSTTAAIIPEKKHGLAARFTRSPLHHTNISTSPSKGISAMFSKMSSSQRHQGFKAPNKSHDDHTSEGQSQVQASSSTSSTTATSSKKPFDRRDQNDKVVWTQKDSNIQGVQESRTNPEATTSLSSASGPHADESTDSEHDPDQGQSSSGFRRKLSTNKEIPNAVSLKEGYLMKQTSSFQRWHRRYFKIKGKKLFYAKDEKAQIFDEIDLSDVTIADSSSKAVKHCFQVITPDRVLNLAAENRSAMEEWIHAVRSASNSNFYESGDHTRLLSGSHVWYATSHARPTYCNICREQLCGVTSHGLSCEICKFKAHKKCASKAQNNCKWTTLASMGKEIIEEPDGTLSLPHQWLEGNLPVSAKCDACEKTCGSVLRLQDWRCLWCRTTVHNGCRVSIGERCSLGRISVVPPTALHTIGSDDAWEASRPLQGCSPLLVFVKSTSGDHQGLKFLRRFKQLLNPAQVFDLMNGGPRLGLQLFRHFEPFRILVCGGDGSVGWVMTEIDRLDMHRQCQVGVLPLGTGNDLARVLGWGASCDDDAHLPHLLEKYERSTTKMLDRWSVMAFERGVFLKPNCGEGLRLGPEKPQIAQYEDSVVSHLQNILQSNQHQAVINSAKVLCETVRDMIGKIGSSSTDTEIDEKCANLSQKLNSLLQTLQEETEGMESEPSSPPGNEEVEVLAVEPEVVSSPTPKVDKTVKKFRKKEALMSRANSLKKAVRQIIEHAEKTLDETTTPPPVVIVRPMTLAMQQQFLTDEEELLLHHPASGDMKETTKSFSSEYNDKFSPSSIPNLPSSSSGGATLSPGEAEALCSSMPSSPIDPHVTLPVPRKFSDQYRKLSNASSTNSSLPGELEDEIAEPITDNLVVPDSDITMLEENQLCPGPFQPSPHIQVSPTFRTKSQQQMDSVEDENENKVQLDTDETEKTREEEERQRKASYPKIEIESPSSSVKTPKDSDESSDVEVDVSLGIDSSVADSSAATTAGIGSEATSHLLVPGGGGSYFPRGASPRASRRISMGSLFKPLEVEIPKSPRSSGDSPDGCSYSSAAYSPFSSSAHSTPNKYSTLQRRKKTLPIVNPLVSDPSWPAIASGGVVSKVLLANADAICAVASPLMDPDIDQEELMIGFDEKCVMNNYFGIGIDAKITLDFHLKREEHPEKCRSRTRNFVWYGVLGGKEFLNKSCKNLEQKVQLECDGKRLPLPSLQGIVILNIQSFMGGTNFWGGTKEDDCFLAPSFDDRILEVVAVFDTMQMAASRLINLQHHRIAQCQSIKITIVGDEPIPVQVDGEAWLQAPGVIRIVHKNRMQMLCRNRALESSLKAWEEKQKHLTMTPSPTEHEELDKKRHSRGVFKLKFKREKHHHRNHDNDNYSDGISDETGSSEIKPVDKWNAAEVGEWLEHLQLEEYKLNFLRHDIQGSELLTLQRRDLRELGVTKVGHIKRILQSIDKLKKDSLSTATAMQTSTVTPSSDSPQHNQQQ